ncbi:MAG TPA: polysaccharide deacetylase family protein [Nitrospira sp.]|nr:polysaccharide deacetylase family protein [Nitrospira sp.]
MALRAVVKTALGASLRWTGANRVIETINATKHIPLVIGYHSVVEDVRTHLGRAILPSLISSRMLERQLDWLGQHFRFLSLDELGERLENGDPFNEPLAAITFDDGYAGVYHHALPLLQRKGIPAGMFVVTETLGRGHLQVYDKLYLLLAGALPKIRYSPDRFVSLCESHAVQLSLRDLKQVIHDPYATMRLLFTTLTQKQLRRAIEALETVSKVRDDDFPELHSMTWDMVRELDKAGMTIGSHTQTHALLTLENPERMVNQVVGSLLTLQHKLRKPVSHFAYPDGRFNPTVVSCVAEAGYRFGYTTCLHRDTKYPSLTIPRKLLWENSSLDPFEGFSNILMHCHAHWIFDLFQRCHQDHADPPGNGHTSAPLDKKHERVSPVTSSSLI